MKEGSQKKGEYKSANNLSLKNKHGLMNYFITPIHRLESSNSKGRGIP